MRARLTRGRGDESGQILVLILGFIMAILLLITFVVDASQVFLYQRSLHSVADGAALEASDAIDTGSVYSGGSPDELRLSESLARNKVEDYEAEAKEHGQAQNFDCRLGDDFEATRVHVRCDGQVRLPFVGTFGGDTGLVDVPAEASAETFAN